MSSRSFPIRTDIEGNALIEVPFRGVIHAVEIIVDSLTNPDVDVSDGTYETSILSVDAVAADVVYAPGRFLQAPDGTDLEVNEGVKAAGPAVVLGTLKIEVAGGGAAKRGRLTVLYE